MPWLFFGATALLVYALVKLRTEPTTLRQYRVTVTWPGKPSDGPMVHEVWATSVADALHQSMVKYGDGGGSVTAEEIK